MTVFLQLKLLILDKTDWLLPSDIYKKLIYLKINNFKYFILVFVY